MQPQNKLVVLWEKVVERIKLEIIRPTLWRSLEAAVPVLVENNEFVVGFPPGGFHMSGNLTVAEHRNAIEVALREYSGLPLTLRVIEGSTLDDWNHVKSKDQSLKNLREEARRRREKERTVTQSWETLLEQIGRKYAATPLRQLPQSRAKYIQEVLILISDVVDELMPEDGPTDELAERSLARALDKAAQLAEISPVTLAMELQRMRERLQ